MAKKKTDLEEIARKLNLVGTEACRSFIQLQCFLFYYWDSAWEMIDESMDDGEAKDELHHCFHEWRERLKSKVLECGGWNERVFELNQEAIPGLIPPDVPAMIEALKVLYDEDTAGVK